MKVKVWNDNKYDHTEPFKGKTLTIKAGEFIEMDYDEAVEFKGQFTPPRLGGDDAPDPRFFKMIRVEKPPVVELRPEDNLRCHADGSVAATQAELIAKLLEFAPQRASDPEAERKAAEKRAEEGAKIASLEAQIAELKALVEKQAGRGRKEAVGA